MDARQVRVARGHEFCAQTETPRHDETEHARERHDPDSANLEAHKNRDVAESGPVRSHVDRRQTRDTDGRHGREEGVGQWGYRSVGRRDRQRENRCEHEHERGEDDDGKSRGARECEEIDDIPYSPEQRAAAMYSFAHSIPFVGHAETSAGHSLSWYSSASPSTLSLWQTFSTWWRTQLDGRFCTACSSIRRRALV